MAEALWVVRAGLEIEEAAALVGVSPEDIAAALDHPRIGGRAHF